MRPTLAAVLLALSTLAAGAAQAQGDAAAGTRNTWWGFIALGPGNIADSGFYASGIGGGIQRGRVIYMARVATLGTEQKERINDAGILMGIASRPQAISWNAAMGLGVAKDSRDSAVVALPIEAGISFDATRRVGLGLRLFGSVNGLANFSGLTVSLRFGRLK